MSLVCITSSFAFSPAPHASFCDGAGWDRVWSDEFDGTTLDETVWTKDVRGPGDSKTRAANATADSVWVEDGALVIRSNGVFDAARGSWTNLTSGAVDTKGKQSWAGRTRVCVRAKLPGSSGHGNGIWPAHWLMPDDTSCWPCHGEVDIMEMVDSDGILHGTYHWCTNETCGEPQHLQHAGEKVLPADWSSAWHEYAVEYNGDGGKFNDVVWAFDGVVYSNVTTATPHALFWDAPRYIILNTAIGDGTSWPKPTDENTILPVHHYVDYVRVSQTT